MPEMLEYRESELTRDVALAIAKLAHQSFADSEKTPEQRVAEMLEAAKSRELEATSGRRWVIWDGSQAIAHARTFIRVVLVNGEELPVLALATVCTAPDQRGQGLGAKITRKAFAQVGQPGLPAVSLFQTPVPVFYEKLDCRIVCNRFVNLQNAHDPQANPWRDDTVMIYPADFPWPQGTIDLNGPDY